MDAHLELGSAPFQYVTQPDKPLDLGQADSVGILTATIKAGNARLVVVDALQQARGGAEENSASEMGPVMHNARLVVEQTGATVIVVHHIAKTEGRSAANAVRGSTAIMGALDFSFHVKRDSPTARVVTMEQTKARDAELKSITTEFCFEHWAATDVLRMAWFKQVDSERRSVELPDFSRILSDIAHDWQRHPEGPTKTALAKAVGGNSERAHGLIDRAAEQGVIKRTIGPNGGHRFRLGQFPIPANSGQFPESSILNSLPVGGGIDGGRIGGGRG